MDSKNQKLNFWGWIKDLLPYIIGIQTVKLLCQAYPLFYEYFYLRGCFQVIRVLYDYTLGLSPIPSVYLLFCFLLYLIYTWVKLLKQKKWNTAAVSLVKFTVLVFFFFYFLWGFNYSGQSINQRLALKDFEIQKEYLEKEILQVGFLAEKFRHSKFSYPQKTEKILRSAQTDILQSWSIPTFGRVRIRRLHPKGVLLRMATAGVYIPFAMEGHIDAGLHPITWPAIMAHEMAHGYGVTDEGTCNFIAYITCIKTEVTEIQYSGTIMYMRYLLSNYRKYYSDDYAKVRSQVPKRIISDIRAIEKEHLKYPNLMPKTRVKVYDYYLKSHGVKDGLKSYSKIIEMIAAWKNSEHNPEVQDLISYDNK